MSGFLKLNRLQRSKFTDALLLSAVALVTFSLIWLTSVYMTRSLAERFALEGTARASRATAFLNPVFIRILKSGTATPYDSTLLRDEMEKQGIFHLKLFDANGVMRYDTRVPGAEIPAHPGDYDVAAVRVALSGVPLSRIAPVSKRLIAEIYAPIEGTISEGFVPGSKPAGVHAIYVEETEQTQSLQDLVWQMTLLGALLAALAFGVPAWLWKRRSARLALRERELDLRSKTFKAALDYLPVGVTMFDRDGKLAVVNSPYIGMFNLDSSQVRPGIRQSALRELRMEHGMPVRSDYMPKMCVTDAMRNAREVWELHDGRTATTARYPTPDGGWVAVHEDISESLRHVSELETTRRFLHMVIDNTPGAIAVKDPATLKYLLVNKEFEKVIGLPREEIIGTTSAKLFGPEYAVAITKRDQDALQSNNSRLVALENKVLTPGNGERLISTKRFAIRDEQGQPTYLLTVTEDVTDKRRAEEKIKYLAQHDALTGLHNRAFFKESFEQSLANMREFDRISAILIDLDGFKEINDTFGHPVGDEVLRITANRLRALFDIQDVVARLGGDEFAVLCRSTPAHETLAAHAQRIIETLQKPMQFEDRQVSVDASIGIAIGEGGDLDFDQLVRQADVALYEAKADGKGICRFFDAGMMARRLSRKTIEADMHVALTRDEFVLHYQPIVDLTTGAITSLEALVRWEHPIRGMIPPADFIPMAEESGLIVRLGEIVLQKACADAVSWPDHVRVSVNLSPIQFRDKSLPQKIAQVLADSGLPPARLELEITEASLLADTIDNVAILTGLRDTGIRIVMDDFGTGYSSLNYLRSFPFDKIKIDRSYVKDLEAGSNQSRTILDAVVAMARGLDLSTTAEGVETQAQMDILRHAGCTEMQGYFFSKPVPKAEIDKMMQPEHAQATRVTRAA